jgi:hypothetical protein
MLNTLQQLISTILKWKKPCHVLPWPALPCPSLCYGDVQHTNISASAPTSSAPAPTSLCPFPCLLPIPLPLKSKASPPEHLGVNVLRISEDYDDDFVVA